MQVQTVKVKQYGREDTYIIGPENAVDAAKVLSMYKGLGAKKRKALETLGVDFQDVPAQDYIVINGKCYKKQEFLDQFVAFAKKIFDECFEDETGLTFRVAGREAKLSQKHLEKIASGNFMDFRTALRKPLSELVAEEAFDLWLERTF